MPKMPKINEIDGKTPEQMEKIMRFANNPKGFLLLAGANGTGKSFIARAIYQKYSSYQLPYYDMEEAFFINQADLNERWIHDKAEGWSMSLLGTLKNTKLLIIDDFGTRTPSDSFSEFLYALIDHRWYNEDRLGTIITTNLNAKTMREKFGDAILSRVASGIMIRFDGEDRRIQIDF
jgi:DNA replication protein DnaC